MNPLNNSYSVLAGLFMHTCKGTLHSYYVSEVTAYTANLESCLVCYAYTRIWTSIRLLKWGYHSTDLQLRDD